MVTTETITLTKSEEKEEEKLKIVERNVIIRTINGPIKCIKKINPDH